MKKKRIFGLAGLAAVVLAAGVGIYYTTSQHDSKGNGDLKVVTSFYPVYEFTKQIVGDFGGIGAINFREYIMSKAVSKIFGTAFLMWLQLPMQWIYFRYKWQNFIKTDGRLNFSSNLEYIVN